MVFFMSADIELANRFLDSYMPASKSFLNRPYQVKELSGFGDRYDHLTLYTDGSAKGTGLCDDRSFGGWGVHYKLSKPGAELEGDKFGNLFNTSSSEAELRAVLECLYLIKGSAKVDIVTDSADVINGFYDIKDRVRFFKESSYRFDPLSYRKMKLWSSINDVVEGHRVKSLSVRWVRSHQLDKFSGSLPSISSFKDSKGRGLFMDCLGNSKSDQNANLGAIKAVRGALHYYRSCDGSLDPRAISRSLITVKKNFDGSLFARDEAVRYLSQHEEGFIPNKYLLEIFDQRILSKVASFRELIEGGANIDALFESRLTNGCVISSSDPRNLNMFVEKLRSGNPVKNRDDSGYSF